MTRIYLIIGLVVALGAGAGYWRYSYVVADNKRLKDNLAIAEWTASEYKRLSDDAQLASQNYQARQEVMQRENTNLRNAVDSNSKQLRVKIQSKGVPCTNIPGGSEPTYAQLDADARQAYFDLRAELGIAQNKIKAFEEMKAKAESAKK